MAIIPLPEAGKTPTAQAVVSTERGKYRTIQRGQLLKEIARRIGGATNYACDLHNHRPKDIVNFEAYERNWLKEMQPLPTDFKHIRQANGSTDVTFD